MVHIPILGPIWMLVELGFLKGTPGPNRYDYPPGFHSWLEKELVKAKEADNE